MSDFNQKSYEEISKQIDQLGKILMEKQEEIERKQKDIQAYQECNERLTKLVRLVVVGFLIIFLTLFGILGYTISEYKNLESSVNTTTETTRQEFQTDGNGVIINGNGNSGDINGGKWFYYKKGVRTI